MTIKNETVNFATIFSDYPGVEDKCSKITQTTPRFSAAQVELSQLTNAELLTKHCMVEILKNGISQTELKALKNTKNCPELDLHGFTQAESLSLLQQAIKTQTGKVLKIIHGKGKETAIIKSLVYKFAKSHPRILAAKSLADSMGESGSLMLLLAKLT